MAKLMVVGRMAEVEILTDPEDEELLLAKCRKGKPLIHSVICSWEDRFDTTDDAWAAAEQHADGWR